MAAADAKCMGFITLCESRRETSCLSSGEDSLFSSQLRSQDWFYISQCFESHSLCSLGKDEPYVKALTSMRDQEQGAHQERLTKEKLLRLLLKAEEDLSRIFKEFLSE
ncbi:unnamed protein product [Rangifer tarandus platyrhynchus]|uniref:Uncharacterized protein n=2 Tax=Rangifer tarandus platyrhynchus TaxID=3082113 RepID=A0AC59YWZ6_RANTA|nr:unnamed protein product [Rangifer tarandus platyrhynchus]